MKLKDIILLPIRAAVFIVVVPLVSFANKLNVGAKMQIVVVEDNPRLRFFLQNGASFTDDGASFTNDTGQNCIVEYSNPTDAELDKLFGDTDWRSFQGPVCLYSN